jgi:ADP-ribose pyrophosphatase YjhB (NUDIX family)
MAKEEMVMVSAAVVFKKHDNDPTKWFIISNNDEDGWEIPKTVVRRGESSVRASIRITSEQAGMRTRVLEEVGRGSGATKLNNRPVTQKFLYYLMNCKDGGEIIGFNKFDWVEYKTLAKRLTNKRDLAMVIKAKDLLKELEQKKDIRTDEEIDEIEEDVEDLV